MSNLLKSKFFLGGLIAVALLVVGSTASAAYMHTGLLKMGQTSSQVMSLQQTLNGGGFLVSTTGAGSPGMESMYFGAKTKAAVMAFQAAKGLSVDGVVGAQSGAALAAMTGGEVSYPAGCTSTTGFSTTTGMSCSTGSTTLPAGCTAGAMYSSTTGMLCSGGTTPSTPGTLSGEGSVKDFSIGSAEETDISEGQSDMELVSFDVELENDGSLKLDRFDLYMGELNGGTHSSKPWDYFKSVTLMADGKEIASMNVDSKSDWSEYDTGTLGTSSQEYRLRFTDLNSILPSDETTAISVAFDSVSNLDSADEGATWQFGTETDSFRFEDATGFIFTDGEDLADSFTFDTALEGSLTVSSSTNDPDAMVVEVDDSADTNGVKIGVFEIEENEGADVNITEMDVVLATSDTITDVVKKLYIYDGSTMVGQETVTGTTVTFDNIDLNIDADDTVELTIKADFDDTNDQVRYQDGDTVSVSSIDLTAYTDEFDNDEGDFSETGSYASETHALYANGIDVEVTSATTTITDDGDGATFVSGAEYKWTIEVTAFGNEDVYINKDVADIVSSSAAADVDMLYSVEVSTGAAITGLSGTVSSSADSITGDSGAYGADYNGETFYKVKAGTTETLEITVTGVNQTQAKQTRALLNDIEWTTDLVNDASGDSDALGETINSYTFNLGEDAATPFKGIN